MPKIDEVLKREQKKLPALQQAVLDYLESHPDEVFSWNREDLSLLHSELKVGTRGSVGWSIWALRRHGHIEALKVGRRRYYGSKEAIRRLAAAAHTEDQPADEPTEFSPEVDDTAEPRQIEAPGAETVETPVEVQSVGRRRGTSRRRSH